MTLRITGKNNQVTKFKGVTKIGSLTPYIGPGTPGLAYGALFNGIDQSIIIIPTDDFAKDYYTNSLSFTIEFFAKGSVISSDMPIFHFGHNTTGSYIPGGPPNFGTAILLKIEDDNQLNITLALNDQTGTISETMGSSGLSASVWKHFLLQYNQSTKKLVIFVDGSEIDEKDFDGSFNKFGDYSEYIGNDFKLRIGHDLQSSGDYFNGEISNFRWTNNAVYTYTGSTGSRTITVPTSNLTALTDTKLLLFNGGGTLTEDQSGTSKTVTNLGNVEESIGPFGTAITQTVDSVYGSATLTFTSFPEGQSGSNSGSVDVLVAITGTFSDTDTGTLIDLGGTGTGVSAGLNNGVLRGSAFSGDNITWGTDVDSSKIEYDMSSLLDGSTEMTIYLVANYADKVLYAYVKSGNTIQLLDIGQVAASPGTNTFGSNDQGYGRIGDGGSIANLNNLSSDTNTEWEDTFNNPSNIAEIKVWYSTTLDLSNFPNSLI